MVKDSIRLYFEKYASVWGAWQQKNQFYHAKMLELIRRMVPPGAAVLELGSGTGDVLAGLEPQRGIGLNLAEELTTEAQRKYPHLEFYTVGVDQVAVPEDFRPDYVIMNNMLDYVYDVWDVLEQLNAVINEHTLLVITTNNPLWAPLMRLGSKMGQRIPDSPRNFITNKDIRNVLQVQDFDIVEEGMALPMPRRIPVLGDALNMVLPEIPVLRYASSIQYIAARSRMARGNLSCSVVVPCHNEEDNVAECVRRVGTMGAWTEIVMVDDGSTDRTRTRILETMQRDARVRLIAFDQNQGKANAVHAGFQCARGDVVMILDADMAVMPEDLPKFHQALQTGSADFVNGTRLVYPMQGKAMKIANYLGNKAFCFLTSWILRQRVSDTLCGTKAMLRDAYMRMPRGGKERWGDFDFLFGAARLGLRILEVPVHYQERRAGDSKMHVMRDGWLFLKACWHGWRMLRFANRFPWAKEQDSITGWRELDLKSLKPTK